eukprot:scaffold199171_cov20-Prasinocladus_malaysianus.AAC.1
MCSNYGAHHAFAENAIGKIVATASSRTVSTLHAFRGMHYMYWDSKRRYITCMQLNFEHPLNNVPDHIINGCTVQRNVISDQ